MDLKVLQDISDLTKKYNAQLLPVIKDKKIEEIKEVYDFGFREFGENRLEQLLDHKNSLEKAMFHFIAPLQSRKIDEVMNNCVSIHTLSRKKEALIINKNYSNQKIFIQINIDNDPNKSGIKVEEVDIFFSMFEDLNFF